MAVVFAGVPQVFPTFSLLTTVSFSLTPMNRNASQYSLSWPMITTQTMLFYTLITVGFEHFLCSNQPN